MNNPFANYLLNFIIVFCKFYFANYVIEFWKKIYPIFSYFQILFRELFIMISLNFGKKFIRFFRFSKFCFTNYSLNFEKKNYSIFLNFKFCFANYSLNFFVFSKFIFYFANYWFKFGKFGSNQNFDQKLQYKNHVLIKKRQNLFKISYYVNIFIFKSLNSFIKSK